VSGSPPAEPFRWRPLTPLLLAAGVFLLLSAVLTRNPVPLFLAVPLLLAPLAAGVVGPRGAPTVGVRLSTEGTGPQVHLYGTVTPPPGVDARDLVVGVRRPASLLGDRVARFTRTGAEVQFRADWYAPVPVITEIEPPPVVWRDPMGLVERAAVAPVEPLVISRYPPELLRIGTVRLERTTLLPGETRSRRIGDSGEFHGIRTARPEDPPRQINWLASARAGRRLANEYDLEKTGDLLIVLDARPTILGTAADEHLFSIARAAAVGLCDSFLAVKARVGLGVFGEFLDAVPLATGRTQRIRLEAALKRSHLTTARSPPERCAVSVRRVFPPGITTVVLSSLADDASADVSPYLRRRGYPVVVLSPSPLPLLTAGSTLSDEDERLAQRIARLVRRNRIARAWKEAPTIDWDDYWSLGQFVEFVRRPRIRRAG